MEKSCFALLHAVLLVYCLVACLGKSVTNITSDQSSLLALKAHITFDPHGVLANNWSTTTSICNWVGVTCGTRHQRVTSLDFSNFSLEGTIPPHLGNLSFLVSLDLSNNTFSGHLPNELVHLRRLKFMKLGFNKFSGHLPSWLGALTELQQLHLGNNSFTGTIPPSFSNMSKLESLRLSYNFLQGMIPKEIGNLQNLKILDVQDNQLTGSVPVNIFNISSLQVIALSNNGISGDLPMDMCYGVSNLQRLYLSENQLHGQIPSSLYQCSQLQILSLSYNKFSGAIPRGIWNSTVLNALFLGGNNLEGEIPQEIGSLLNLEYLGLENAGLIGPIPSSIFNITSLKILYLNQNNLTGVIPQEIGGLHNLEELNFGSNSLEGPIPATIFNISTLRLISLPVNHFSGNLPSSIGLMLPYLEILNLGINNLTGNFLDSISNASQLTSLNLISNGFTGSIPNSLGNLVRLQQLNLAYNYFVSDSSSSSSLELTFLNSLSNCRQLRRLWLSSNPLNGILPASIGNLSTSLQNIVVSRCGIKGSIPDGIGNLSNLAFLHLFNNDLSGVIPTTIKWLRKLQVLYLHDNRIHGSIPEDLCHLVYVGALEFSKNNLSGPIPACLENITSLRYLYLNSNRLTSTIPTSFWSLQDVLELDLSSNSISGGLAPEIGKLNVAMLIDLSMNQFSGDIPSTVAGLENLIHLSLAHNIIQGKIPESFGSLPSLEFLDLSQNNLSGVIPKSLDALFHLKYFNVSFNRLSGEIPTGGPFRNFTYQSFMSNEALCGAPQFQVRPCHISKMKRMPLIHILLPIASILLVSTILFLCLGSRWRRNKIPIQTELIPLVTCERIAYHELVRATDGFSEINFLGMGSFGSVYKATLTDGTVLAAKVFNLQQEVAFKSFDTECEILRNIRHRNLTKVISTCSNLDFKALILEYMPNGSLEKWLYSHNYFLDILQRLDIMIDVACALAYLHHDYSTRVVHCDLKPSNVLLDEDMVAHVSDFGIARFLEQGESIALTKTLATFGYIAPEYGLEGLVSTRCDVYSYGIMLMETFTRRKPTDEFFAGDLNLKGWVNESLPNAIIQVIDSNLLRPEEEHYSLHSEGAVCIIHHGTCCELLCRITPREDRHERCSRSTQEDQTSITQKL